MATLTVQDAPIDGGLGDVVFAAAAAGGDDAATGSGVFLVVRNGDTVVHTVTVTTPGTVRGLAIEDPLMSVPASGGIGVMPLVRQVFGASAAWVYDAETSVDVAVVKLER